MTLRVDLVHPRLDPRVYKEAKELLKKNFDITVLCWSREDSGYPLKDEYEGIKIERVPHRIPPPDASRLTRGAPYLKLVRDMARAIKRHRPDILHCHDTDTLLEASIAHRKLKMPFIFDSHEDYPAMVIQRYPLLAKGTTFLEKFLIGNVDHVIAATAGIQRKFDNMDKDTTLVYNSRPTEDFVLISGKERSRLRKSLGFTPDDFVLGYAGMMGKTHSTDLLIKALSTMTEPENSNVKLLLIGGPEHEYKRTSQLIKDTGVDKRAKVLPMMPFQEIMKYYQVMDAGAIIYQPSPNLIVAAPNKLFEFMGLGLPMIAHDYPEMRSILHDNGRASILVDPTDMKAIIGAVETLANDPALRKKYSKRLKELLKNRYNWELQRRNLYTVYERFS
jgi:glycosyltransferase involved in cell wall biosynthesis